MPNAPVHRAMRRTPFAVIALAALLGGCMVGPDYVRPAADAPGPYKAADNVPAGWKEATPADQFPRGHWWEIYNDPELNRLEDAAMRANPSLVVAYANYRAAQAQVGTARAGLFPVVNGGAAGSRAKGAPYAEPRNAVSFDANASWELDLWGQVRRAVEASQANAAAAGDEYAGAMLSIQAELAQDYFSLRTADSGQRLLDRTVDAYERSLDLTQNRYNAGVAARADVVQAEAQLKSAQASAIDNRATRASYEHAIAVLVGVPPQSFSLAVAGDSPPPPSVPPGLPSQLLERRPDIAAAERRVAAANAEIGVATAAFYPTINLAAAGGVTGSSFANLFSLPATVWSIGASAAQPLFDGGLRKSALAQNEAAYDAAVATYKSTVLTGFQEVQDNLTTLAVLADEAVVQQQAVDAAQRSVELTTNQYKAGIVAFLNVVTAQAVQFNNERTLVILRGRQLLASVALVKAIGGGWNVDVPVVPPAAMASAAR
ncbi:MAG: efflux transporter outer membrane subunit [Proteobacteria bacterium]|nr:efflux transporter outer membrane subunit [Pseudomonadota bacterium]